MQSYIGINEPGRRVRQPAKAGVLIDVLRQAKNGKAGMKALRSGHLEKIIAGIGNYSGSGNTYRSILNSVIQKSRGSRLQLSRSSGARRTTSRVKSHLLNQGGHRTQIKVKIADDTLHFYIVQRSGIVCLTWPVEELLRTLNVPKETDQPQWHKVVMQRAAANPIIQPVDVNRWESAAVFNSAAIYLDNKVHLVYRAIGESGLSVFGYASSNDGTQISERITEPSFVCGKLAMSGSKKLPRYAYSSGGSWWGSEDPRLTQVADTIYMTYTAFDGHHPPCVALTSIKVDDFLNRNWNWKPSQVISQPGKANKNWVLFPEKINGHFAVLHSITPTISIAYQDTLDFEDGSFITSEYYSRGREDHWDNWIRGVGPPPIRTKDGWLVLYHAMDRNDPDRYKIGALLLDEHEPEKILHRSSYPLLEPDHWYENEGHKRGVVYTCGAALIDETLFVYYGGADSCVCIATIDLNRLLHQLKSGKGEQRPTNQQ